MRLVVATHVYPLNPRAPSEIPGSFLPPFVSELCRQGADIHVLAANRPGEKVEDPGAPVRWFEWWGDGRALGQLRPLNPLDAARLASLYWNGMRELKRLIRETRADAVFACWAVPAGALAAAARRSLHTPYAVWSLGSDIHTSPRSPVLRPMVVSALKNASLRYCNSLLLAREVERLSGQPCEFLALAARPLPAATPAELPRDRVNFLYAGRFEPIKGVDILIEAFDRARNAGTNAHLYLAGNGSLEGTLRDRVRALGLEEAVSFLGFLSDAPLASYLSAVDAVVIPSRAESLPVVFLEAARFGTPAVATDVGDMALLARQYGAAVVVEKENVEALAAGIQKMAESERAEFKRGLPALVEQFDVRRAASKLLADMERVLSA